MLFKKYILVKDLPSLKAGAIFEHRKYDVNHPDRGNMGHGVLLLGWLDGNCQQSWAGETFVFPGQLATNRAWFHPMNDSINEQRETEKQKLLEEIEKIKKQIQKL